MKAINLLRRRVLRLLASAGVGGDGPAPTGKRYCSNGVALRFVATT